MTINLYMSGTTTIQNHTYCGTWLILRYWLFDIVLRRQGDTMRRTYTTLKFENVSGRLAGERERPFCYPLLVIVDQNYGPLLL